MAMPVSNELYSNQTHALLLFQLEKDLVSNEWEEYDSL